MKRPSLSAWLKMLAICVCAAALYAPAYAQNTLKKPSKSTTQKTQARTNKAKKSQSTNKNMHNRHEYVDLGLNVMWATCNVGAKSPEDYGQYFAWGEIRPKSSYIQDNSATTGQELDDISGKSKYDAASANWGGQWRMPTIDDVKDFFDNVSVSIVTINDVVGMEAVSKINGKKIFLPYGGTRRATSAFNMEECGNYWISTPHEFLDDQSYAINLYINEEDPTRVQLGPLCNFRDYGLLIRPVFQAQ